MSQRTYFFTLEVPYHQCEAFYQPGVNKVVITADSGERIQIPTKNLRPYMQKSGLNGRFRLIINDLNKVISFDKIA